MIIDIIIRFGRPRCGRRSVLEIGVMVASLGGLRNNNTDTLLSVHKCLCGRHYNISFSYRIATATVVAVNAAVELGCHKFSGKDQTRFYFLFFSRHNSHVHFSSLSPSNLTYRGHRIRYRCLLSTEYVWTTGQEGPTHFLAKMSLKCTFFACARRGSLIQQ